MGRLIRDILERGGKVLLVCQYLGKQGSVGLVDKVEVGFGGEISLTVPEEWNAVQHWQMASNGKLIVSFFQH